MGGSFDPAAFARNCAIDPRIARVLPTFDVPFFQAGLAGYSDAAMRLIARRHGCPYAITEAMLDRILLAGGKGLDKADLELIADNVPGGAEDHPIAGQIIGSDAGEMAAAARLVADMGYDVVDVNLACPVKKIARKARGGHFLAHPQDAVDLLHAVRDSLPPHIPTTIKMRRGYDDSGQSADAFERIFHAASDYGYSWATVHGRTVEQKYLGPSRWSFLADLCHRYPDRVIFGSGDIFEVGDIFAMLHFTGVKAVSVARGCIGNPWIFRQARQLIAGQPPTPPTLAEQRDVLLQHYDLCLALHGDGLAGKLMRKFGIKFSRHHPDPDSVKERFIEVESCAHWRAVIDDLYSEAGAPVGVS